MSITRNDVAKLAGVSTATVSYVINNGPRPVSEETRQKVLRTIPLGRVGTPEEIAAPILFLCTEHAGFITGEIFNVNGGAVLAG